MPTDNRHYCMHSRKARSAANAGSSPFSQLSARWAASWTMVLAISMSVRLIIAPGKFNLKTAIRILHAAQKAWPKTISPLDDGKEDTSTNSISLTLSMTKLSQPSQLRKISNCDGKKGAVLITTPPHFDGSWGVWLQDVSMNESKSISFIKQKFDGTEEPGVLSQIYCASINARRWDCRKRSDLTQNSSNCVSSFIH